MNVKLIEFPIK